MKTNLSRYPKRMLVLPMLALLSISAVAQTPSAVVKYFRFDCTANTGSATIQVNNATGPFSYDLGGTSYSTSDNPFTIGNISPSSNLITIPVYDNGTLVNNVSLRILPINLSNVATTPAGCGTPGSLEAQFPYGGSGRYEYRINNGDWQQPQTFGGLSAGSYVLEMRDYYNPQCTRVIGSYDVISSGSKPVISFSQQQSDFCNNMTVTANVSPAGSYDFTWSSGQTTPFINLNTTDASGAYMVTVSAGGGCSETAIYTYNEPYEPMAYNVLATNDIILGSSNVINGSVGITVAGKTVAINKSSVINGYVRSGVIKLTQPVTVTQGSIFNAASFALPANKVNTVTLPPTNITIPDNGTANLSGNYNNVTIGKAAKVILSGTIFGKITAKEGAEITFTQTDINIGDIVTFAGKAGVNYTTLNFPVATAIRIKNGVVIEDRNVVNSKNATFYMSNSKSGAEKFTVYSTDTRVNASVYMPIGKLAVHGTAGGCTMTGTYIAQSIYSDKGVTWNSIDCSNLSARPTQYVNRSTLSKEATDGLQVQAYPNPSSGEFTLQVKKTNEQPVMVRVFDATGKLVSSSTVVSGNLRIGNNLKAGSYYAEVIQGTQRQIVKLVKQ